MIEDSSFETQPDDFEEAIAEKRELAAMQEDSDLRWLMSDPRGRRICSRILEHAGVLKVTFTGEALTGAFNEGQRSVGNRILTHVLDLCPEDFVTMLKEFRQNE